MPKSQEIAESSKNSKNEPAKIMRNVRNGIME